MPTIPVEGFLLIINTRDERGHAPHVHVVRQREKCKIMLDERLTPYDIRMSRQNVRRARELVGEYFGQLLVLWDKFNG